MPRLEAEDYSYLQWLLNDEPKEAVTRPLAYLALNYAETHLGPASAIANDKESPIMRRIEEIILAAGMDGDSSYDEAGDYMAQGRMKLIDPALNPAPMKPAAQLIEHYDAVDAHFDAQDAD